MNQKEWKSRIAKGQEREVFKLHHRHKGLRTLLFDNIRELKKQKMSVGKCMNHLNELRELVDTILLDVRSGGDIIPKTMLEMVLDRGWDMSHRLEDEINYEIRKLNK